MTLDTEQSAPMGWKLFLVDRVLSNDEIASTFAEIFDLEPDDVMVIEAEEETDDELPENISILCERSPVKGDFQLSLSIYPQDDELEEIVNEVDGEIDVVKRFADILECNCLIIDPSDNIIEDEDACIFIQSIDRSIQEVYLDSERLNSEEYVLIKLDNSGSSTATFFLDKDISWMATDKAELPYQAKINDTNLELGLNDFPEEYLYTLFINSIPTYQFNDLPNCWKIP